MNREAFLRVLRGGLRGLSRQEIEEIVADYEAHFAEAHASGRSEAEVAQALGDPVRLARELRAETGLRRFEAHRSVANLATAAFALAGLAAVDIFFLLPLLLVMTAVAIGLGVGFVALGAAGVHVLFGAVFPVHGVSMPGVLTRGMVGFGLIACCVFGGSLLLFGLGTGVRALGRYARLHYRLLEPGRDEARASGRDTTATRRPNPARKLASTAVVGMVIAVGLLVFGALRTRSDDAAEASWARGLAWRCAPAWLAWGRGGHRTAGSAEGTTSGGTSSAAASFPFEPDDSLDIDLPATVSYRPGGRAEATVSGDPVVVGHVRIANGRLGFDEAVGCIPEKHLRVELTAPPITRWAVHGSGELTLSGLDQPRLELRIRGSGRVAAAGTVQDLALHLAGSGTAQLQALSARSAAVVARGSGEAEVTARDSADIAMAGSGVVRLHGRPPVLHSSVSGSGRIESAP